MMSQDDLDGLKTSQTDFWSDFAFPTDASNSSRPRVTAVPADDDCDLQSLPRSGATTVSSPPKPFEVEKKDAPTASSSHAGLDSWMQRGESPISAKQASKFSYGTMVDDELLLRKRESLGMAPEGSSRRLGEGIKRTTAHGPTFERGVASSTPPVQHAGDSEWTCLICTL